MHPPINSWQSLPVADIQSTFGGFTNWVLCGGRSIDWILGKTTREHGDTDIGVFRSDLIACLNSIDQQRVYLCDPPGQLLAWDGISIPEHVHDIWITNADYGHWTIQLMIYDDTPPIRSSIDAIHESPGPKANMRLQATGSGC
ncbi:hypothetical protein [uncultured Gimesia sp.]|uniref:hypothetical protein n=1 Tax=uncultured Gimesia sp. TaxID=1678688 RepID=UPI0030DA2B5C|tara:strand:+ start:22649 stop:23077 length:429 start_codon:yes stop_codon:yes gene_type:complete